MTHVDATARYPRRTAALALAYRVVVVSGPDTGQQVFVEVDATGRVLVGSSPLCQIHLRDAHVSRRHLALEATPDGLLVIDLASTNGTTIDGVRVREALAPVGGRIVLGESVLSVELGDAAKPPADEADTFGRMVGRSGALRRLFALGKKLARSDLPVFIEGGHGIGKGLFAESLHEEGPRAGRPFVVLDAGDDHVPSALHAIFGAVEHEGTRQARTSIGALERANGGTLLLDEPGDLPPEAQRRLAKALSRKQLQRVASDEAVPFDVRILSTSSNDPERLVEDGRLREDLYFLLVGARVELPPLSKHPEDVVALIRHFHKHLGGRGEPAPGLVEKLLASSWPGNVRELENAVARHLATGELDVSPPPSIATRRDEVPAEDDIVTRLLARDIPLTQGRQEIIAYYERRYVERILQVAGGNVTRAARDAGLTHRYFQALKAKYGR